MNALTLTLSQRERELLNERPWAITPISDTPHFKDVGLLVRRAIIGYYRTGPDTLPNLLRNGPTPGIPREARDYWNSASNWVSYPLHPECETLAPQGREPRPASQSPFLPAWVIVNGGHCGGVPAADIRQAQRSEQRGQGSAGTGGRGRRGDLGAEPDRRRGPDVAQSLAGPQTAAAERKPAGTPAVLEPEIATTSAELPPARWTEELAGDFTAGLEPAGRRMALHVWRSGERGIHRSALCRRTELTPAELRSLLMRMGHALRRFQLEWGMTLPRPVAANSPLQGYFINADFAVVVSQVFGERMPDQLSSGLRRP